MGDPAKAASGEEDLFEVVIEEDVVPLGQLDFSGYLRWKEAEAARRADGRAERPARVAAREAEAPLAAASTGALAGSPLAAGSQRLMAPRLHHPGDAPSFDVGPSSSTLQRSVYSGVASLLKIAVAVALLAGGVIIGATLNPGVRSGGVLPQASGADAARSLDASRTVEAGAAAAPRVEVASAPAAPAPSVPAPVIAVGLAPRVEETFEPFGVEETEDDVVVAVAPAAAAPAPAALRPVGEAVTAADAAQGQLTGAPLATTAGDPGGAPSSASSETASPQAAPGSRAAGAPASSFAAALALHERGDLAAARAAYEATLAADPTNAKALNNLALIEQRDGAHDRAEVLLKEAVAIDPTLGDAFVNLGNLQYARGARDQAEMAWRRALKVQPGSLTARRNLARALEKSGELVDAEAEARRLVEAAQGRDAGALALLGRILARRGDLVEARRLCEEALALDPGHAGAAQDLGALLLKAGDAAGARRALDTAIAASPRNADAFATRAAAWLALGKGAEAKADVERALQLDPGMADAHYQYALVAERYGNYVAALEEYQRALEIDARHARAANNMGVIYLRGNKARDAVKWFESALDIEPSLSEAQLNLGLALWQLGRKGEAQGAFDRCLSGLPQGSATRKAAEEMIAKLRGAPGAR